MSGSGSFGVNYKKVWDGTTIPLPAKVRDVGHSTEGSFVFVQASGAIGQYDWVHIDTDGQAAKCTTTLAGQTSQVGAAQVAAADNEYLWVFVGGAQGGGLGKGIKGNILTGYVAKNTLYTTSTAGAADDAATTKLNGVVGLAATTGTQAVELASTAIITT
jgi:hypothetical protein